MQTTGRVKNIGVGKLQWVERKKPHNFLKKSQISKLGLAVIALVSLGILLKVMWSGSYPDFNTYYYGVRTAVHGGNPYIGVQQDGLAFLYPSPAILLLVPFSLLPLSLAGKLFTVVSVCALAGSVWILFKLLQIRLNSSWGLFLVILICNFFPTKFTLGMGQINNIVLLLISLFLYYYSKQKDRLAGVLLGIAFVIKLFPVLLVAYLIIERRWIILASFAGAVALATCITLFVVHPSTTGYFLETALPNLTSSWKGDYYNQAVSGWLMRDVSNSMLREILRALVAVVLPALSFFLIWRARKTTETRLLAVSILVTVSLMVNSFSWQHHFVWLLVPLLITANVIRSNKLGKRYFAVLGIAYVFVAVNLKNPGAVPVLLQSHVLYGAGVLYILSMYLLSKRLGSRFAY